jgi:hypothetical protein
MKLLHYLCFVCLAVTCSLMADRSDWSAADHLMYIHNNRDRMVSDNKIFTPGRYADVTCNLSLSFDGENAVDDNEWDGSLGVDIAVGRADKFVRATASVVATSIGILKDGKFADRGFINFSLERDITENTSIELYFNQMIPWGTHLNERKGYSFSVAHTFTLPWETKKMPEGLPLRAAIGTGTGGGFEAFGSIQRG